MDEAPVDVNLKSSEFKGIVNTFIKCSSPEWFLFLAQRDISQLNLCWIIALDRRVKYIIVFPS